jgi:hypothetical protein
MKKMTLVIWVLLTSSLFATDVSNFDIKGIKLGMSKDDITSKISFNYKFDVRLMVADNPNYPYQYILYKPAPIDESCFNFIFDKNLKVYDIARCIPLDNNANFNKVISQVIKKYGTPKYKNENEYRISMCWGDCILNETFRTKENGKTLQVSINKEDKKIYFYLMNQLSYNKNKLYSKRMYKKAKEELENKASNIDL